MLSRGLISGHWQPGAAVARDFLPRYQGANADANLKLVEALRRVADFPRAQPATAWVAAQGTDVVPLAAPVAATG